MINHIEQCKIHLEILLEKLGVNETQLLSNNLDWPAISASFSIISSDMIAINKSLKEKSCYSLKSCVFVPKVFSEDVDQNLQVTHKYALLFSTCLFLFCFFFLNKSLNQDIDTESYEYL